MSEEARRGGYLSELWRGVRRRRSGLVALVFIVGLAAVAALAPFIAGTKPIVCSYKGSLYFPAVSYWNESWESAVLRADCALFGYPQGLREGDPESWALWPLFYADPYRRIDAGEWPGRAKDPMRGAPSATNLLGTDTIGRDVLARMVHGASTALLVGFVAMGIAAAIGVTVGALAGYFGGWVDVVFSRVVELVMAVPPLILIVALVAVLERPTIWHLMAVIGLTRWESIARYTRAEFLRLRESEFVLAARVLGVAAPRIMLRHILPNALAPIVVTLSFGIAGSIVLESALSFLGLGSDPAKSPSWGRILNEGKESLPGDAPHWWLIVFPGLAIFVAVLAYNLLGDAIQEASDPRRKR